MAKRNQESLASVINETVTMDTRKFLSAINGSAQSQVAFFEDAVRKLGEQQHRNWRLTALQSSRLFFEDVDSNEFMVAEHTREKGGRVKITNVARVVLHEDKKPELFEQSCHALVESIEKGDAKEIDGAYNKIAASRFRSTAIPQSGIVKTKDGVVRQMNVAESAAPGRSLAERIVAAMSDQIVISESGKLEGSFTNVEINPDELGVSELSTRRLVAKYMQETAQGAYKSGNFQTLVEGIASLICKDRLEEAVGIASKFLREHQEFCLLDTPQWEQLVSNTLATRACFNEDLARDTATLMRKTNLKVNRTDLVEAWKKTAEKAQHPLMLENVDILSTSENFEEAYEQFLPTIFEVAGEATRNAMAVGLQLLRDKVLKGEVNQPTSQEVDQLIKDLQTNGDSKSVWTAVEALNAAKQQLKNIGDMDNFDEMPGPLAGADKGADVAQGAGAGAAPAPAAGSDKPIEVTVRIDPMKMAQDAKGQEPAPAPAPAEGGGNDEFDLSSLDEIGLDDALKGGEGEGGGGEGGAGGGGAGGGGKAEDLLNAGKEPTGPALSEEQIVADFVKQELGKDEKVEIVKPQAQPATEDVEIDENAITEDEESELNEDPYKLPDGLKVEGLNKDYRTFIPEDLSDSDILEFDKQLQTNPQSQQDPNALQAQAEAWIREKMKDKIGAIQDPKQQQQQVTDMAGQLVAKRQEAQKVAEAKAREEQIAEDQRKSPLRQLARRGLKKAAVNKLVKEGKLQWLDRTTDAVLGEFKGVRFVLDSSESPVALLSENGEIQVPVPDNMIAGALYVSEASDKEADGDAFVEWLDQNIESFRVVENGSKGKATVESAKPAEPQGSEATVEQTDSAAEPVNEGGLPDHLKQYQFKKKDGQEGKPAEEKKPEDKKPEAPPAEDKKPEDKKPEAEPAK